MTETKPKRMKMIDIPFRADLLKAAIDGGLAKIDIMSLAAEDIITREDLETFMNAALHHFMHASRRNMRGM